MAKNFSDKYLASLKPKDKPYKIREAKGFSVEVLPSGTKTFLFIYEVQGKRKQLKLGTYPFTTLVEARDKYNGAVKALYSGEPITKEVLPTPKAELTLLELVREYIGGCSHNTKAWVDIKENTLVKKLVEWHDRPISSITRREAYAMVDNELKNGKGAAGNVLRVARAMFEYAVEREYLTGSPFSRLRKGIPALKTKPRTRFLTGEEIKTVWQGISETRISAKRILLTILVTAQRPGEVAGMHRREISGDWWTIPAERALKGGRDHRVFLTALAKELIGTSEGYIFPGAAAEHVAGSTLSRSVERKGYWGVSHWTPHDLRRTARTHMSRLRVPSEHAEAVLNHAKQGMVKVYDQYEYDDEKREALQAWERELLRLVAQAKSSE